VKNLEVSFFFLFFIILSSCSNKSVDADISSAKVATFQITGLGCTSLQFGTGFFIDEGLILTNAHVVAGVNAPKLLSEGEEYFLDVVSFDAKSDLALLNSPGFKAKPLSFSEGYLGQDLKIIAYLESGVETVSEVVLKEKLLATGKDIFLRPGAVREVISLNGYIEAGFSGSPVINDSGDVVGVVFSRVRGGKPLAYAVQASEVKNFLDSPRDVSEAGLCQEK
tara:strand:- start:368 stop:1036 length:669 start_codon:yes stop_codon:yes gene_type:complete